MTILTRRSMMAALTGCATCALLPVPAAHAQDVRVRAFVEAASRMREQAIATGDQAYGAVVVRGDDIVGWGPSRVVAKSDWTAHAEREAIRDAQARLKRGDLSDCAMYSTSRPCVNCERAAAEARLARMYFGADATDAGPPRR